MARPGRRNGSPEMGIAGPGRWRFGYLPLGRELRDYMFWRESTEILRVYIHTQQHTQQYAFAQFQFQAWIEDGCTFEQSNSEEESSLEDSANATMYIQMKFCPEMLHGLLESPRVSDTVLDTERVWRLFRQLVEGVRYIHKSGFVHRDLTRSNIFFDENNNVQIGDFGLATFVPDMSCGVTVTRDDGNLIYMAPELKVEDDHVSDKADIFSLGLVLCDLLYQFSTDSERAKIFAILIRRGDELPHVWDAPHPIVAELLALTPSARPSASQLLQRHVTALAFSKFTVRHLAAKRPQRSFMPRAESAKSASLVPTERLLKRLKTNAKKIFYFT